MNTPIAGWIATGWILAACATAPLEPEQRQQSSAPTEAATARATAAAASGSASRAIGDPCVSSDGWVMTELSAPAAGDGTGPAWVPANGMSDQAPTGVGYCLAGLPGYPQGYFTANCNTDGDCPSGSFCDGANPDCPKESDCRGECRKPCKTDRDCAAPMTCSGGAAPKSFCYASTGVRF